MNVLGVLPACMILEFFYLFFISCHIIRAKKAKDIVPVVCPLNPIIAIGDQLTVLNSRSNSPNVLA